MVLQSACSDSPSLWKRSDTPASASSSAPTLDSSKNARPASASTGGFALAHAATSQTTAATKHRKYITDFPPPRLPVVFVLILTAPHARTARSPTTSGR